jgi:hypothetical protein
MKRRSLYGLSNHDLIQRLRTLAAEDRSHNVELIRHIAEVARRRLYKPRHRSMYQFCLSELNMSEPVAYKRVMAGYWACRHPVLLDAIEDGRLHLSAVMLIGPHLTRTNVDELVRTATHQTKAAIKARLVEISPRPKVETSLTPFSGAMPEVAPPVASLTKTTASASGDVVPGKLDPDPVFAPVASVSATVPERYTTQEPLSPQWIKLVSSIRGATSEKLRRASDLLSHEIPSGEFDLVLDKVLDLAIAELEKRKCGATDRPHASKGCRRERGVSAAARRAVWTKHLSRCAICGGTRFLEIDHIVPLARGGTSAPSNLRLLCRDCNRAEAERIFGPALVAARMEKRRGGLP